MEFHLERYVDSIREHAVIGGYYMSVGMAERLDNVRCI